MDMDADWPLPQPVSFRKEGGRAAVAPEEGAHSAAETFIALATPVVDDAVRRARELATHCDPEGFHQLRVAFRRLRALYWAYSPYLGEEATSQATEEFKRLAAIAGGTRDWDIASDLLKDAQASRASMGILVTAAKEKRAQAVAHSQAMIKCDEVESFLNDVLLRARVTLASTCHDLPLRAFAEERVRRAQRALKKRSRLAARSEPACEEELHDVRKAGKKLRYLLEFFEFVVEGERERRIKELTSVQNKLGQFNDIAASVSLIRSASFNNVPPEVVEESLHWLEKQKNRRMQAAARRVRDIAG
ncbi:CHAD domain-containing protein [Burkholderia sp. 8Y]|uniref:CHAD domain-containing protein n=1 Tax=Burkholderia sp. 8Y TaxID=2653133 RepID=UPI001F30B1F0